MKEITQSDLLLRKLEAGIIDLATLIKEHQREKELTFDEKIDNQIKKSINGIMLGVDFRLSIKVMELRHKEDMLCININSKFSEIQRKYCYEDWLYDTDYHWNSPFNKPLDFSYFRVDRILNIKY